MKQKIILLVVFAALLNQASSAPQDAIYNWQTGGWGVCWSGEDCGPGTEERTVWCGDSLGRPVPGHLCDETQKPSHSRPCYAACKGQWKVGVWSACEQEGFSTKNNDGLCPGIRQRNISCITNAGEDRTPICSDPAPPSKVSCYTLCPQDCGVGPWSPWTPCANCQDSSYRTRMVIIAPAHKGKACPELSETKACSGNCSTKEEDIPFFQETSLDDVSYKVRVSQWGDCVEVKNSPKDQTIMESITQESSLRSLPVVGIQKRNVTCIDDRGGEVHSSKCRLHVQKLTRQRSCVVPVDCQMTQWSSWNVITKGCVAPNGQVVREGKERKRSALYLQKGTGSPCPHLVEKHTLTETNLQPCSTRHQWLASAWGPCLSTVGPKPESEVRCGGGVQKRQIICVRSDDQVPVAEGNCQYVEPPPRYQRCEVGCERDCSLDAWSDWGICTNNQCELSALKKSKGFRIRRRGINVVPSVLGKECPALEEQITCSQPQCYQWVFGEWSECTLINSEDKCGSGKRSRNNTCQDPSGLTREPHHCVAELGFAESEESCWVPCPYDCVLSTWSQWTPCSRPCSYGNKIGSTRRNTSILAPPGQGGRDCPAADELTQMKTCHKEPCGGSYWKPEEWSECRLTNEDDVCGEGVQERLIICYDSRTRKRLSDAECSRLYKPREKRQCEILCSMNCNLSNWSDWSPCLAPSPCPTDGRIVRSIQRRWRRILVDSLKEGNSCGELSQERDCALISGSCLPATWKPGQWSECILPKGVSCGGGYRIRDLPCVNGSGEVVEPTHCLLGDKVVPSSSEKCFVFCNSSCAVSSWSRWSTCPINTPCSSSYSRRSRQLLETNKESKDVCKGITVEESQKCPCQLFYSEASSDWSECIISSNRDSFSYSLEILDDSSPRFEAMTQVPEDKSLIKSNTTSFCGVGSKYRSLKCVREDGTTADPSYCDHSGLEVEPCMKECPTDCLVHSWGEWSECDSSCGAGTQQRHRKIVQKSLWGGRKCPQITQTRACWGQCQSQWISDGWTDCQLEKEDDCGNGTQYRTVRCAHESDSGMYVDSPETFCDPLGKPMATRQCTVFCPGECVVSEWSNWSICQSGCINGAERVRTRSIVRQPSPQSKACPHLEENESCKDHTTCWKHEWRTGNWTSCVPLGHSSCGEGVKNRVIACTRSDGRVVGDGNCVRGDRPTPQDKWCYVDCPVDCETSLWSDWDKSKCSCGDKPGEIKRTRFILVNPSESGRSCPVKLEDSIPCPFKPCFNWERGPWSQCELQGGDCGHGTMERRVSCRGPGGIIVNDDKCLNLIHIGGHTWPSLAHALDLNTKDGCYVPCDGDCEMTEWSAWSHCHRDCNKGQQGGVQTRSRAILSNGSNTKCPGNLWESRDCLSGPCLTFSWQVIHQTVTCVRSDGLVVTGGCGDAPRPCLPQCSIPGSFCSPVGICVCKRGLKAHYSQSTSYRLTRCVPLFNLTLSKASALSQPTYLPENINGWMFAMIGVGSAFVVFVIISVYVMCKSPRESLAIPLASHRHQPSCPDRTAHAN